MNRRPLLCGMLWLLCAAHAPPSHAQTPETLRLFEEGNRRYTAGEYAGARDAYEQAAATGYANAELFYNLGNVYYRMDEIGQAVRHYEKARRILPEDPRILHNLEVARTRMVDRFALVPPPYWEVWWQRITRAFGASGLFFAGLLLYFLALTIIGFRILTRSGNPWLRRAVAASLAPGILLIGLGYAASLSATRHDDAVVLADTTALRQDPSLTAPSDLSIHEGTVIRILAQQDGWLSIRLPNGETGWIDADDAAEI